MTRYKECIFTMKAYERNFQSLTFAHTTVKWLLGKGQKSSFLLTFVFYKSFQKYGFVCSHQRLTTSNYVTSLSTIQIKLFPLPSLAVNNINVLVTFLLQNCWFLFHFRLCIEFVFTLFTIHIPTYIFKIHMRFSKNFSNF